MPDLTFFLYYAGGNQHDTFAFGDLCLNLSLLLRLLGGGSGPGQATSGYPPPCGFQVPAGGPGFLKHESVTSVRLRHAQVC